MISNVVRYQKFFYRLNCCSLSTFTSSKLYLVDAFASKPFTGNPAAVVLQNKPRGNLWLQNMATEINSPVIAFVCKVPDIADTFNIRWFTPKKEIDICGHATLAATHVIFNHIPGNTNKEITFQSNFGGTIMAGITKCGNLQLSLQSDEPKEVVLTSIELERVAKMLDINVADIIFTGRSSHDMVVEVTRSSFARIAATVDYAAIASLGGRGLVVTCVGKGQLVGKDDYFCTSCGGHRFMDDTSFDYLLRGFFPRIGLDEDHVTGSAQCALVPYYFSKLSIAGNHVAGDLSQQRCLTSYQGSRRGGVVRAALVLGAGSCEDTVIVAGSCVTILESTLMI